jgi:hypothetical protein
MKRFFKNWKTTLAGIGLAILNGIIAGNADPKTIGLSAGIAILGVLAKDPDKNE